MGRRTELKSVVNDLCQSLASRNNDFNGYWSPGQIYSAALDNRTNYIQINILGNIIEPSHPTLCEMAKMYKEKVFGQLKRRGLDSSWVEKVQLDYWFETEIDNKLHSGFGIGKPFIGQLTMQTDMGKIYSGKFGGYCKVHDPCVEVRRCGF
jgi:hypothetical protein